MKILLIMGALGGVQRHVEILAEEFLMRGHSVSLVAPRQYSGNLNIPIVRLNITHNLSHFDIINMIKVFILVYKNKYDIVHGHSSKGGAYIAFLMFFKKTKTVFSPHAFYTFDSRGRFKVKFFQIIEKLIVKCSNLLLLSSNHELRHARNFLKINQKIITIPNCLYRADNSFKNLNKSDLKKTLKIGFCGRLCYQKNPLRFINILNSLPNNFSYKAFILGTGEYLSELQTHVKKLGLENNVFFIKSNLANFFSTIDILLITSRYEGNAYLYQDSLINSTPIISTNVGGSDFYIENGYNGFIFSTNSQAIQALISIKNNRLLNVLKRNCRNIQKKYKVSDMVENHLSSYIDIL